jgi:putative ABC transport system substrate-binding protein
MGSLRDYPTRAGIFTGFLTSESAITAKMFELLAEIAPSLKRVAMLFNPDTAPGGGAYYFRGWGPIRQRGADRSARP